MSYKTELQLNNIDLQSLIDTANSLPEHENLDSTLSEQDSLIAQISEALEGKMVPSGEPTLIDFIINYSSDGGTSYIALNLQAEEGMNWGMWSYSKYNVVTELLNQGASHYIYTNNMSVCFTCGDTQVISVGYDGTIITAIDVIDSNKTYSIKYIYSGGQ